MIEALRVYHVAERGNVGIGEDVLKCSARLGSDVVEHGCVSLRVVATQYNCVERH